MDGVGMVNASMNSHRIRVAATTANRTESNHSRKGDFFALTGVRSRRSSRVLIISATSMNYELQLMNYESISEHLVNDEFTNRTSIYVTVHHSSFRKQVFHPEYAYAANEPLGGCEGTEGKPVAAVGSMRDLDLVNR